MNSIAALVRHSLRRRRAFLLTVASVLFLFQFLLIGAGRALHKSGMFAQMGSFLPDFMQGFVSIGAMSFRGMVTFGYSHPIVEVFLIAMAIAIAGEPAGEIDSKFIDLVMARPVMRTSVIGRSIVLLVVCTAGAIGSMLCGTFIGVRLLTPAGATPPSPTLILELALNLAVLVLAWGAIALLVSASARRQSTVSAIAGLAAFVAFIIDYVGRIWTSVSRAASLSPFHYYSPFQMLGGAAIVWMDVVVLAVVFVIGSSAAIFVYDKRDL